jgi:hypothetical protein
MKHKALLLIISCVLICVVCCKKESSGEDNLTGKWQEVKLRTYILDSGKIIYDTTYLRPFTSLDYAQFKDNDSCLLSTDHYYYGNEPGYPKNPPLVPQFISRLGYVSIGGGKFVLNIQNLLANPAGFVENDTISTVNSNNMIHRVVDVHVAGHLAVTDSYYKK